jgi:hypothetical protein
VAKFKKGEATGRPKGAQNKLTRTVKETVLAVFDDLQSDPRSNLLSWGKDNPTEFYKIAAKLIPTEIKGEVAVIEKKLPSWIENEDKHEP